VSGLPLAGTTPPPPPPPLSGAVGRRDALTRRIRLLTGTTIAWNSVEAGVALAAGAAASSTALLGFGLDSLVEVSSAAAVAWQFAARTHARREARERRALRVTALSFFGLAVLVTVDGVGSLAAGHPAGTSAAGLVLAAVSLVVMPVLSLTQRRAGRELGSASAVADSGQTLLCTYLSAVLLVGLGANALFGWWWADPLAGLVIAALAVREGRAAWRGEGCCAPAHSDPDRPAPAGEGGNGCAAGCHCCAVRAVGR